MYDLGRGVQIPGYIDKKTEKFVHIDEMVPEIVMPDLKDCNVNNKIKMSFDRKIICYF